MNKTIYSKDHIFLAAQLKKARVEAGFDQKKAAKLFGKTQSYISKIEAGQRRIDVIQLQEFSRIYNKSLDYFITTIMDVFTLKKALQKIKKLGFVLTHRTGDTGIGKTLEDLLCIRENNIPLHDILGVAELKAYRKNAKSMLTLFTLEPYPPGGARDRMLLDYFGYSKRDNGRSKELHSTLSCKRYNNQSLRLSVLDDKIRVRGKGKRLNIYWDMKSVQKKFNDKLPALVYVLADTKIMKGKEHFYFNEAYLLKGFDFELFQKMVKKDEIVVDFRMYYRPDGSVRNHGTGFRVKIQKLYNCFRNKERLM